MMLRLFVTLLVVGLTTGEVKNKGWWRNAIFYQIYPRSFMDGNGDGIGDLKGITNRLEHFVESGIDGVWLSPIYASPMVDFGYDISDFRKVDPAYGTMEDLEELTSKAKKLGIKIVLDFVPNHTSDKHEWFAKSVNGVEQYKDYYTWRRGKQNNTAPPNNWISLFTGPAWTYRPERDLWYLHQFDHRQPDVNFSNPLVRREMEDVLRFWLSKGVDGFRIDATPHFYENDDLLDEPRSYAPGATDRNAAYLKHIYTMDDQRNYELILSWRRIVDEWSDSHDEDEKVLMTEAYTNLANTTKYYKYGSNVPFNFYLLTDVTNASKPSDFKKTIDNWMASKPADGTANWVTGNHDRSRIATLYPGRADQMTMLSMTLPGIAVTYYGEEIAMEDKRDISWEETQDPQACNSDVEHYQALTRDPNRTPFQWDDSVNAGFSNASTTWLPVNDNYKDLNLAKQKSDPESHYKLYQTLTKLRRTTEALRNGTLDVQVLNQERVLAVIRRHLKKAVILLINFSNDLPESVNLSNILPGTNNATVVVSSVGSGIKWGSSVNVENIKLPPKVSVVVIANSV